MKIRAAARALGILFCFLIFFCAVLVLSLACVFSKPVFKRRLVSHFIRIFSLCLVRILNIRITVHGSLSPAARSKGIFLVSNHLSYTDGFVLGSLFPVIYIGKSEIEKWPLIGLMTAFSGTLFIDRKRKNHVAEYIDAIAGTLSAGANVLYFPEGTSTNGEELLPFKAAFFEAPILAGTAVVPVSLAYTSFDGRPLDKDNRDRIYWYADMTFAGHFFRLMCGSGLEVCVTIHSPLEQGSTEDRSIARKRLSEAAHSIIRQTLCAPRQCPECSGGLT